VTQQPAEWWARARRARDRLIAQLGAHPAVVMVDIGLLGSTGVGQAGAPAVGVRVHVRGDTLDLVVPTQVDGIPVEVIAGDYRLEGEA
jgi:hypothetical protein